MVACAVWSSQRSLSHSRRGRARHARHVRLRATPSARNRTRTPPTLPGPPARASRPPTSRPSSPATSSQATPSAPPLSTSPSTSPSPAAFRISRLAMHAPSQGTPTIGSKPARTHAHVEIVNRADHVRAARRSVRGTSPRCSRAARTARRTAARAPEALRGDECPPRTAHVRAVSAHCCVRAALPRLAVHVRRGGRVRRGRGLPLRQGWMR